MSIVRCGAFVAALLSGLPAVVPLDAAVELVQHEGHGTNSSSALKATEQFRDVRNAGPDYAPVLGCVSGPEIGAMGVHFVNGEALEDDLVDPKRPEALIYEFKDGAARLVGVEFIVFADVWQLTHSPQDPPVLGGHLLHFVESPNRFGLPAFYELQVWAWRDNPNGAFVDGNPRVSCDGQ